MTIAADHSPAPQAPEEAVTTTLYRAAIGPVSNAYYLPIFTRFEAVDHAGISWNTAAALTTVNWLVFRQLWAAALAYVGALVAIVLLVFGIGRLVFQFSDTLMMALALGFGLTAFVLPGLFGNAVFHAETRKRMAAAVGAHAEIKDAAAQLARQASTRRRAIALAVANAALGLLVLYSYLQFSALSNLAVMPQGALEAGHVAVGRTVDAPAPATSTALSASAPASAPVTIASAPAPALAASQAVSAPSPAASAPASAALASSPVASAPAALPASTPVSAPARAPSAPVAAAPAPAAKASAAPAKTPKAKEAEKPAKPVKAAKVEEKTAAPKPKASAPAKAPAKASAAASAARDDKPYFINVGLFAKPENAANAHAKLLEAQLPSVTKELKSAKLPSLTRVRVGPFDSQLEAQAAAARIKALQLDAIIVQP